MGFWLEGLLKVTQILWISSVPIPNLFFGTHPTFKPINDEMTMVLDDETFPFISLCPQVGSYLIDVLRRLFCSFRVGYQTALPEVNQV